MVRYELKNDVAVITVDNPPVNALSPGVPEAIENAVARAAADPAAKAVVLIGAGSTFIAGADIRFFEKIHDRETSLARSREIHARLRRIEDSPKPVVAAIHGTALGGGLEVAMACHYRVAVPSAKVGQPEVQLGIIPGAGGTQRLPRLAGIAVAVEMCTLGQQVPARRALEAGILDAIVDGDLLEGAIAFARSQTAPRRVRELPIAGAAPTAESREALAKSARGAKAPFAAIDAIEAGATLGFDTGCQREIELFADCVLATESRAMVKLFFAERDVAKIPDVPKDTPVREIGRAAVIGAGTMGGGIAMTYANAGIPVLLKEATQDALDRGLATIRRNYQSSVNRGKITAADMESTFARITPTLTYEGFENADIVVEAAFEDMILKTSIFADLGRVTRPDCILASNTSTLDIDEFARASSRPANVIGTHFFSPANIMRLLEVVRGRETGKETIATCMKLAKRLGKVGVLVGNCFGFVANRMIAYYLRESYLLLEEGATVPQVDEALVQFGMPVGPFAMQDIAGIDVGARIRAHLKLMGKERAEGPQSVVPDWLYEMGRYGQKTGAGWYRYETGNRKPIRDPLIDELAQRAAAARGVNRRTLTGDEIVARIMTALANEGANILEEGFALRPGDIDVIYVHGFGFPRHRGGPMFYADTVGTATVLARVMEYRNRFGEYWRPAPLLERLAAAGKGFYDAGTEPRAASS